MFKQNKNLYICICVLLSRSFILLLPLFFTVQTALTQINIVLLVALNQRSNYLGD